MNPLVGLKGALVTHRKVLLLGGAGVAAALGVAHHRSTAGAGGADGSTTGATVAGYAPTSDTSGTDVYNALQPQVEQTQNMLQQLLDAIGKIPKSIPTTPPKPGKKPPKHPVKKHPTKKPPKHRPPKHRTPAWVRGHLPTKPKPAVTVVRRVPRPGPHAEQDTAYVARRGDTVATIATRTGTNVAQLAALNRGITTTPIVAGARIVIPNPQVRR